MNNNVMDHVVVVCNAPMDAVAERLLTGVARRPFTLFVGVDGGASRLSALGVLPHVVTGDFDSLTDADLARFESQNVTVVPTPDQDYTDLDKALTYVRSISTDAPIEIFGAVGGRLDHTYSVLSSVIKHGVLAGADIRLVDGIGETRPVRGGELVLQGDRLPGRIMSLLTFGIVREVTVTGVRWGLNGATLAPGVRDGTLNEITDTEVLVRCEKNAPLLVQTHHSPLPERTTAR
ncbi:MAG: thiamine diphosphokinase [Akkermansiaceae bacterium]|nr:thiamine diphosphokinase [Armatimonadota bacterium]